MCSLRRDNGTHTHRVLRPMDLRRRKRVRLVFLRADELRAQSPSVHALRGASCRRARGALAGMRRLPRKFRGRVVCLLRYQRVQLRETREPARIRAHEVPAMSASDPSRARWLRHDWRWVLVRALLRGAHRASDEAFPGHVTHLLGAQGRHMARAHWMATTSGRRTRGLWSNVAHSRVALTRVAGGLAPFTLERHPPPI